MVGELLIHTIFSFCFTGFVSFFSFLQHNRLPSSQKSCNTLLTALVFLFLGGGLNKPRAIVQVLINLKMDGIKKKFTPLQNSPLKEMVEKKEERYKNPSLILSFPPLQDPRFRVEVEE